jgi:hypothetical protein
MFFLFVARCTSVFKLAATLLIHLPITLILGHWIVIMKRLTLWKLGHRLQMRDYSGHYHRRVHTGASVGKNCSDNLRRYLSVI